jgi:tRNA-specific 2-thiouridylase
MDTGVTPMETRATDMTRTGASATLEAAVTRLAMWRGRRVVVAMSGGVDSSLTAALLHLAGAEVIGIHMRTWHYRDVEAGKCERERGMATCCSPADARDAARVADEFGFVFYAIDFQVNFRAAVIEPFMRDYLAGRTPNPCVNCNNRLKLGSLLAKGEAYGAEAVATGHYGRVVRNATSGRYELRAGVDANKDQTYYLYGLTQAQLARFLMPLGELSKPEVRELAREVGLHLAEKPDSYEICFVTDNNYRRFLREECALDEAQLAGAIVNVRGAMLGRHAGIHNYTIGQRRGLKLAAERPLYVVELLPETQTVVVGFEEDLKADGLELEGINWVGAEPTEACEKTGEGLRVRAKIRYRHAGAPGTLWPLRDSAGALTRGRIEFDEPVRAVTPGQACVAYDAAGESVLLGGTIARRTMRAERCEG